MTLNKYYTPTIDEFRVGFKYEYRPRLRQGLLSHIDKKFEYVDYWKGDIFGKEKTYMELLDEFGNPYNFEDIIQYNKDGAIRVKYLDKEDIESFGFEYNTSGNIYSKDNIVISIYPYRRLVIYKEKSTVFNGIIKNISELEVLLKQLQII